jgi:hypothetical protein
MSKHTESPTYVFIWSILGITLGIYAVIKALIGQ